MSDKIVNIIVTLCLIVAIGATLVVSVVAVWEKVDTTPHVHVGAKVYVNNLKYYNSTYCLTLSDESTNILVQDGKHKQTRYMVVTR